MSNDRIEPKSGRRAYRKPEIKAYGHVLALTTGGTGASAEPSNMMT